MGQLRVMGALGDSRMMWDPAKKAEVDAAKKQFDELKSKGYLAYKVDEHGNKGEVVTAFDKKAAKIILAPPMRGGAR